MAREVSETVAEACARGVCVGIFMNVYMSVCACCLSVMTTMPELHLIKGLVLVLLPCDMPAEATAQCRTKTCTARAAWC